MMRMIVILLLLATPLTAQQPVQPTDEQVLKLYEGLRVADVADGMDVAGLRNVGLVHQRFQALWKDLDEFDHQIRGIAVTVRYVPHNRVIPNPMTPEKFAEWEGNWYGEISSEPFVPMIKRGTVIVIDASGDGDTGSVGSYNSLDWFMRGAVGIVTTGSVRDTDEIIKQKIPVYLDPLQRGRGIRPGRNMVESVNRPVEIGGALVRPGDVIVADGDGVVVVPREYAEPVARAAREVLDKDKAGRRSLYEKSGRPLDSTVRP
ncbi:MAG TPA: RraA family protein [Thermoanaerobaculia bacterium]|nr:RraA family protein [Thermoanaerobaculia bacterium]